MASLIVPELDDEPWPTLGPQVCDFIEERAIFGPGPLKGDPAVLSPEKRAIIYRAYEVYPKGHQFAGRRRFKRVAWSVRKGLAKTELLAWVSYVEIHPEGPVRCDGFDANGDPVGRPVASPYIPLLSYNKDQVEELAYGALMVVVGEGPDADLFDVAVERIARIGERGREDGKAVPIAGSPNAADGARTTFQGFDEPHRLYLPRLHDAHDTMTANLPKRPDADAWSFYVGTAGELGQNSIQEHLHLEAQGMATGKQKDPRFFYFHRDAGQTHNGDGTGHNLKTKRGRVAAIKEATGPDGEYGKGQFADIAEQWERPKANTAYLERVWLNLWVKSDKQAFDLGRCSQLVRPDGFRRGAPVVAGFDGARFRDATAIVLTHLRTGQQKLWGLWERPAELGPDADWEVPEDEVSESVARMMKQFKVWRFNGDPPHWTETLGTWASKYPDVVEEWHTRLPTPMAYACKDYADALKAGEITFAEDNTRAWGSPVPAETMIEAFLRHIGNAGKHPLNLWDDEGNQMWRLEKIHPERKFDACMAAILSRQAYIAALKKGAAAPKKRTSTRVRRLNGGRAKTRPRVRAR